MEAMNSQRKFQPGDKVKTTPQWNSVRKRGFEPRKGVVLRVEGPHVLFEPPEGGEETITDAWLMHDDSQ